MKNFRVQCYICKNTIKVGDEAEHPLDPCASVLLGHYDKEWSQQKRQIFYCHVLCFSKIVADDSLMYILEPDFSTLGEVEEDNELDQLQDINGRMSLQDVWDDVQATLEPPIK